MTKCLTLLSDPNMGSKPWTQHKYGFVIKRFLQLTVNMSFPRTASHESRVLSLQKPFGCKKLSDRIKTFIGKSEIWCWTASNQCSFQIIITRYKMDNDHSDLPSPRTNVGKYLIVTNSKSIIPDNVSRININFKSMQHWHGIKGWRKPFLSRAYPFPIWMMDHFTNCFQYYPYLPPVSAKLYKKDSFSIAQPFISLCM